MLERPINLDEMYGRVMGTHFEVHRQDDGTFLAVSQDGKFKATGPDEGAATQRAQEEVVKFWSNPQQPPLETW